MKITDEMVRVADLAWCSSGSRGMRTALEAVAPLILAEERERCAKIADDEARKSFKGCETRNNAGDCLLIACGKDCLCSHASEKAEAIAAAIRGAP